MAVVFSLAFALLTLAVTSTESLKDGRSLPDVIC